MLYSSLFAKTSKTAPHDADSANARLLVQGGFVDQVMAGVYTWLPLGLRTLRKVENIVREEMDRLGGQEIHMTALQPKENWVKSGRWDSVDVLFKVPSQTGKEYALGPTAEDIVTPLVASFVRSYKDLPLAVYQIQTKFRDELRAKSGVLRGREFLMKDMYSFHTNREDFELFYEKAKQAYLQAFARCGLQAKITESSGGAFTKKVSHEFQVETPAGEDAIVMCRSCHFAQNTEIATTKESDPCPECKTALISTKGIEVGNIFDLSDRFSKAFDMTVAGPNGEKLDVVMGCYGIGITRLVGAIVEAMHDDKGIIWPRSVAPFHVQLISLTSKDASMTAKVRLAALDLEEKLEAAGVEVLHDDREEARAGEKFADADLIGLPLRLLVSEKTLAQDSVEWKERTAPETKLVKMSELIDQAKDHLK